MATYAQIKEWVRNNHGWSIQHDCWIAHCKELAGLEPRRAWHDAKLTEPRTLVVRHRELLPKLVSAQVKVS